VHVRNATVCCPRLLTVQRPLVRGLVVTGAGAQRRNVGAGVGLRHAEGADLGVIGGAVALRHPLRELVGRARGVDAGHRESSAHDRHADAAVAPEELLVDERQSKTRRIGPELANRLETVEADLGRFLDDRPGRLLALVPLGRGGAHDLFGETVYPIANVALVIG